MLGRTKKLKEDVRTLKEDIEELKKVVNEGVYSAIRKPINIAQLMELIKEAACLYKPFAASEAVDLVSKIVNK